MSVIVKYSYHFPGGRLVGLRSPVYIGHKAVATSVIFCSHWQLDILKVVLRQKSKAVACVAKCSQYLRHVAKSSIQ